MARDGFRTTAPLSAWSTRGGNRGDTWPLAINQQDWRYTLDSGDFSSSNYLGDVGPF